MIKEEDSIDYGFINKYINDNDNNTNPGDKNKFVKKDSNNSFSNTRFLTRKSGSTEVFSRIGEGESHNSNTPNNFNKKYNNEDNDSSDDEFDDVESKSGKKEIGNNPMTEAKKEFIKHLEEDSLNLDTCSNVNQDWKR